MFLEGGDLHILLLCHLDSSPEKGVLKELSNVNIYSKNGLACWLKQQSIRLQCARPRFDPWVRKIPWRRKRQPTTVLLPGKFHGRKSLGDYSLWGREESDTTERLYFSSLHSKSIGIRQWYFPRSLQCFKQSIAYKNHSRIGSAKNKKKEKIQSCP